MSPASRSRLRRWAVPAAVAAAIAATSAVVSTSAHADDHPALAPRTAAELLAAIAKAAPPAGLSGTIDETDNLGLPALPSMDTSGAGTLSLQSLVTGTHSFQVWESGPSLQRVALLGQLAETEIVHNGTNVWTYASSMHAVTHATVPAATPDAGATAPVTPEAQRTPQEMAAAALAAIDPSTAVTVDSTARVAGQAAYRLVLTPRDDRTLIGSVRIAIDASTDVPLQVQVYARGHDTAAIDVAFKTVSYDAIDPSVFTFTPPPGATVTETPTGGAADSTTTPDSSMPTTKPTVLGSGWTAVASLSLPTDLGAPVSPRERGSTPSMTQLLDQLATPVPGGRVVTTSLLSILITDDGHVYAGAVRPADLQTVAASGRGL
jgi:outer membrane lipoprotein-sorting protein